jgi:ADP-heptose:LPS heptosyltransferase
VRPYLGEPLPSGANIAVISNDALGNYVVVTPLIQMLAAQVPQAQIFYFGGNRTRELWQAESLLTSSFSIYGDLPSVSLGQFPSIEFDLVINVESGEWAKSVAAILCGEKTFVVGPCLDQEGRADLPYASDARGDLWRDPNWSSADLTARYQFLASGFIAEIFARLAYLDGPVPTYRLASSPPELVIPDILIAMSASLPEKLWRSDFWLETLVWLRNRGYSVGLLGAKPGPQSRYWKGAADEQSVVDRSLAQDLRGTMSLREVVGAIRQAKEVLTLDNGIMHLAGATETPTVALFREGIHRLWTPPSGNITAITAEPGRPVAEIGVARVWEVLEHA